MMWLASLKFQNEGFMEKKERSKWITSLKFSKPLVECILRIYLHLLFYVGTFIFRHNFSEGDAGIKKRVENNILFTK